MTQWQTEADSADLADVACRLIGSAAGSAIAERGRFRLVLAGGNTPLDIYRRLAVSDQIWKKWSLYYGDERCLPADDPQRNSQLVSATGLVDRVGKHFPIPCELGAKSATAKYRERIEASLPFDLVLLGIGEDGHTASLFPGHSWPDDSVFAIRDAPKPPPKRITLGVATLQNCRQMLVLVSGTNKADAVRRWRAGADLPIARVAGVQHALVLIERDCLAAADLVPHTEQG